MMKTKGYVGSLSIVVTDIAKPQKPKQTNGGGKCSSGESSNEEGNQVTEARKTVFTEGDQREKLKCSEKDREIIERNRERKESTERNRERKKSCERDREKEKNRNRDRERRKSTEKPRDRKKSSEKPPKRLQNNETKNNSNTNNNDDSIDNEKIINNNNNNNDCSISKMMTFEEEIMNYACEELAFKESLLEENNEEVERYSIRESIGLSMNLVQQMKTARSSIDLLLAVNDDDILVSNAVKIVKTEDSGMKEVIYSEV